jgi:hypothetical protein
MAKSLKRPTEGKAEIYLLRRRGIPTIRKSNWKA